MQFLEWCMAHRTLLIVAAVAIVIIIAVVIMAVAVRRRNKYKFRRYKKYEGPPENKQQHPKLIVEETEDEYGYMGITEHEKHGKNKNIELKHNPVKGDTRKAYLRKPVEHDIKENFTEILENYNLSMADIKAVTKYLKNRLKVKRQEERARKHRERAWRNRNKSKKKK